MEIVLQDPIHTSAFIADCKREKTRLVKELEEAQREYDLLKEEEKPLRTELKMLEPIFEPIKKQYVECEDETEDELLRKKLLPYSAIEDKLMVIAEKSLKLYNTIVCRKEDIAELDTAFKETLSYVARITQLDLTREQRLWLMRAVMTRSDSKNRILFAIPGKINKMVREQLSSYVGLRIEYYEYNENFTVITIFSTISHFTNSPMILKTKIDSPGSLVVNDVDFFSKPIGSFWIYRNSRLPDYGNMAKRIVYCCVDDTSIYGFKVNADLGKFFDLHKKPKKENFVADKKDCKLIRIPIIYNEDLLRMDVATALIVSGTVPKGDDSIYVSYEEDDKEYPIMKSCCRCVLNIWIK